MVKIKRKWLMAAALAMGASMILYTVLRQFFGLSLGDGFEKNFFDAIFIGAIAIVVLNRKMAKDEAKEAEALKSPPPATRDD